PSLASSLGLRLYYLIFSCMCGAIEHQRALVLYFSDVLVYPRIMTNIRFQLAPKPTRAEKAALGKTGFVPVATRWGKRTLECLDGTM
ncbi:MAG: hypothetical protein ACYTX0_29690, partial [Nostoc sp.]